MVKNIRDSRYGHLALLFEVPASEIGILRGPKSIDSGTVQTSNNGPIWITWCWGSSFEYTIHKTAQLFVLTTANPFCAEHDAELMVKNTGDNWA